jgi:hypothetical protein
MNQEIKNYIIGQCQRLGLKPIGVAENEIFIHPDGIATVTIHEIPTKGLFFFEMRHFEISNECYMYFPIPETLRAFMKVCDLLKVFHAIPPKFVQGDRLLFESPMYTKPKNVTFVEWSDDNENCHVVFDRLGYERNALCLVHSKFLRYAKPVV